MGFEHWESRYLALKEALVQAYESPTWDTDRIDAIATELSQLERLLSTEAAQHRS